MQQAELLHKFLEKSSVIEHRCRQKAVGKAVMSVLDTGKLTVTSLGRHMPGNAKVKNKIKTADRLLNNRHLQSERAKIYGDIGRYLLTTGNTKAIVLIDWSPIVNHQYHLLKASICRAGRSVTLYEELHEEKYLGNAKIQGDFLKGLKKLYPRSQFIIVTDAGFKTDFFEQVRKRGWHFVGRLLTNMKYQQCDETLWQECSSLYKEAQNKKVKDIGNVFLAKSRKLPCRLLLYKEKQAPRSTQKKHKSHKKGSVHRKRAATPWLLATSLHEDESGGVNVIRLYKKRMKIEHEFRDTKDAQWGAGLRSSRTQSKVRLTILLLIGHLALFLLWLIGLVGEKKKWHLDFQANSVKSTRILSLVFLGLQMIKHGYTEHIEWCDIHDVTEAF